MREGYRKKRGKGQREAFHILRWKEKKIERGTQRQRLVKVDESRIKIKRMGEEKQERNG